MCPSSILWTWPIHHRWHWCRSVNMDGMPALKRTSLFCILSCHVIPRILWRNLKWNTWSFCSWVEYVVQDSLPYSRVLMTQALWTFILVGIVRSLFSHTLLVSLERVLDALPMHLLSSTSSDRVSVVVEPRYWNWLGNFQFFATDCYARWSWSSLSHDLGLHLANCETKEVTSIWEFVY